MGNIGHKGTGLLVDTCGSSTTTTDTIFTVREGEVVVLRVHGLVASDVLPVETYLGKPSDNAVIQVSSNGKVVALTSTNGITIVDIPGTYRVNLDSLTDPAQCVKIDADAHPCGTCFGGMLVPVTEDSTTPVATPVAFETGTIVPADLPTEVPEETTLMLVDLDLSGGPFDMSGYAPTGLVDGTHVRFRKRDLSDNVLTYTDTAGVTNSFVNRPTEYMSFIWSSALNRFEIL